MDSLLASYVSSDEEDEQNVSKSPNMAPSQQSKPTAKTFFSSLPPPKSPSSSSSLLFSRPPPKSHLPNPSSISSSCSSPLISNNSKWEDEGTRQSAQNVETANELSESLPKLFPSLFSSLPQPKSKSFSSLFSSLPQPKTHSADALNSSSVATKKRVVQFRPPPMNPTSSGSAGVGDENDEIEEDTQKKKRETIHTSSVKSFLSSIPAPRNSATLGASSSGSGTGRRSIIDTDVPGLKNSNVVGTAMDNEAGFSTNDGYYESHSGVDQSSITSSGGISESSVYAATASGASDYSNWPSGTENYAGYGGSAGYDGVSGDYQNGDYVSYSNDHGKYANHGQYESHRADDSSASEVPEVPGLAESAFKVSGKRGRNNAPREIIEVKQDELIKNRPREDQVKLTGIAFGPSYQPTSTKGKPSKLHKRKHQIGSLFFDMKQKEIEFAERRARGFLTKAQTQGKYGW